MLTAPGGVLRNLSGRDDERNLFGFEFSISENFGKYLFLVALFKKVFWGVLKTNVSIVVLFEIFNTAKAFEISRPLLVNSCREISIIHSLSALICNFYMKKNKNKNRKNKNKNKNKTNKQKKKRNKDVRFLSNHFRTHELRKTKYRLL